MSGFIAVLEESELQGNALRAAEANGVALVLGRSEDGQVCAIADRCAHRRAAGGGDARRQRRHLSPARRAVQPVCSGEVLKGPAREPEQRFEVRVHDGRIEARPA